MLKVIDTSKHNGRITEEIVKQVDGVIVRLGYGSDIKSQDDPEFENTVSICQKLGKPWGAYIYSYALSVEDCQGEVTHALRVLNGRKPELGLWFDMEDADGYKAKRNALNKDTLVNICNYFCVATGAGIYASKNWFDTYLNSEVIDYHRKWVAQWNDKCTYTKPYEIWQFTNNMVINGKRFDCNYVYSGFTLVKSNEEIAKEVIDGKWGNGTDRKNRLASAGYDYSAIQAIVNKMLTPAKKSNVEIAKEVIAGKWGNGTDRKNRLASAGYNYSTIQKIVNSMLK